MSEHAFDTLRFAERMEKAGLTREQASEFSKALGDFMQEKLVTKLDLANLATKEDLKEMVKELKSEIKWVFRANVTILTLVIAAFKFLH